MTPCRVCPLRELPVIKPATPKEIAFIQKHKSAEPGVAAGATILREGETDERLFTLLHGWAFRYKTLPDGRRQILNILLPGDLIGLQSHLFKEAAHGVEALTDVILCAFARERLWEIFHEFPALAFDLTWLCAHEERLVDEGLLAVGRRIAPERVAMLMLHLWHRAGRLGMVERGELPLPMTQAHIADTLGLSLVHTNRTLQLLRHKRLFRLAQGRLSAVDVGGLRRFSRYEPSDETRPLY